MRFFFVVVFFFFFFFFFLVVSGRSSMSTMHKTHCSKRNRHIISRMFISNLKIMRFRNARKSFYYNYYYYFLFIYLFFYLFFFFIYFFFIHIAMVHSKTISNDQELIQSDPISFPQNQKYQGTGISKSDCKQSLRIGIIRVLNKCTGRLFRTTIRHNHKSSDMQSKKTSNYQELIQSDPMSSVSTLSICFIVEKKKILC